MSSSAEFDFYSKNRNTSNRALPTLEELRAVGARYFTKGNRYHLVSEVLSETDKVSRLLEIGCGEGDSLAYLTRYANECVGADIVLSEQLKNFQIPGLSFQEFNASGDFPLPKESFDVVVAMMVMEHVFDPFRFCQEVSRILRPRGVFFLNVPLVTAFKHRLALLRGEMPVTSGRDWFEKREWDGGHLHYFTLPLLKKLLALYGFEVEQLSGVGRFLKLKAAFPSLLASEISIAARRTH